MNYIVKINKKVKLEDFIKVRNTTDFIKYDKKEIKKSLKNSLFVVGVYINNEIVGVARIVGDRATTYFIKDLIVIPEYQKNGVGNKLMIEIDKFLNKYAINNSYIGLMSTKGKEEFYKKYGFIERPSNNFGSGMIKYYEK